MTRMNKRKLKIAIIMGGTSSEHEVSLVSARGIITNLDRHKYHIIPLTITQDNHWVDQQGRGIQPCDLHHLCDIVFPVLHGPYGEDGTIQGLLEMLRIPYVGCGVTSSAVCMDKVMQKHICRDYGIPITQFFWLSKTHWTQKRQEILKQIKAQLNNQYPLFVKPANQGSSVGVTKAHNQQELIRGIELALTRDLKIIIEAGVKSAREIECSVLGTNSNPETSVLGEIIPSNEFYDYEAKYLNGKTQTIIPATLNKKLTEEIQKAARLAFEVLDCWGLARVDFLLDPQTQEYYLNELNTMPGFTPISMYPKLWEASGLPYPKLLDRLIELALKRHQEHSSLNLSK